jgi:signal peptidase II
MSLHESGITESSTPADALVTIAANAERSAIAHPPSHLRLWIIAVIGLAADLWTKDWAFSTLRPDDKHVIIENLCSFQLSLNPGALFGLGAGMAPVFVGASVLALLFVLYLFANAGSRRWSMHVALGLVLGGALGNLYDRSTQQAYVAYVNSEMGEYRIIGDIEGEPTPNGFKLRQPNADEARNYPGTIDETRSGMQPVVRDFIRIEAQIGNFAVWPWIFNIADALLVFGVAVLLLNFWADHRRHNALAEAEAAKTPSDDSLVAPTIANATRTRDNPVA